MRGANSILPLAVLLLLAIPCIAGADEEDGTLELLDGGSCSSSFRMSLGFLYGSGSRPDGLGAPVSTLRSGVAAVSGNPAGLARLSHGVLLLDVLPPFGATASDFVDIDRVADDALDDAVEDITSPDFDPEYPSVSADIGQQGGVLSGALAARFGRVVAAASFEEPLFISMDLVNTGLEAFGHTAKEDGDGFTDVSLRVMADAAADMSFAVSRATIAAAGRMSDVLDVGLSVSRYDARAEASANVRADGIVDCGGQEYAFNDPSDPWQNDLGYSASGAYQGAAYGWGLGLSWRPFRFLTVDAAYQSTPSIQLKGSLTSVENALPGAVEGEFDLDQVLDSQPTLTERTVTTEDSPVTLLLPSHVGLATSFDVSFALVTLEYRRYIGPFGFDYEDTSEGLEISNGVGLELDFGAVRAGGGVMWSSVRGGALEGEEAGGSVIIPMANLGAGMNIGSNLRVDTMLLALPMQILRVSMSYGF